MYRLGSILVGAGLILGFASQAQATVISTTCPTANVDGSSSLTGENIGSVGAACQIGNVTSGGQAELLSATPMYWEFSWGGGLLQTSIVLGNDGAGGPPPAPGLPNVVVELLSQTPSPGGTVLESIDFKGNTSSQTFETLSTTYLTAGTYDIGAYLASGADPELQVNLSVPEPVTLSIFGAGLIGAAAMRRRKKAKA